MTPFELIEQIKSWWRRADNIRDHPEQVLWQQGQKVVDEQGKKWNEQLDLRKLSDRSALPSQQGSLGGQATYVVPSAEGTKIGEYIIQRCLEPSLYEANRNQEQVWLKEYQFSERDFKPEKVKQRQADFDQLVMWNLKIGHGPDFRLLKVLGSFSKERSSYLVTQPLTQALSLRQYLATQGAMRASEVREVLRQVLETLHFLHCVYRVRLGNDKFDRHFPHGNLSLDSLWIKLSGTSAIAKERRFFIYATDLMLWEQVVKKSAIAKSASELGSIPEDLQALGLVGFQLLGGQLAEGETISALKRDEVWQDIHDRGLKPFIRRLAGLENPLLSADAALQCLSVPPEASILEIAEVEPEESFQETPVSRMGCFILLFALVGTIALTWIMVGSLFIRNDPNPQSQAPVVTPEASEPKPEQPQFPKGVKYAIEQDSAWNQILNSKLIYPKRTPTNTILLKELTKNSTILDSRLDSRTAVLDAVENEEADIAFVVLEDQPVRELKERGLGEIAIAQDALVIVVAFSDGNYQGNVPTKLKQEEKKITLDDIKQAFTSSSIRNFKTKPYFPNDLSITELKLFKRRVLGNQNIKASEVESKALHNKILDNFESDPEAIAIGFDRLSRIYGQCSVYPLEIAGMQVLKNINDQQINLDTDLCGDKRSYRPKLPEDYPLSYKLGIVYKQSNAEKARQIAEKLQTQFQDTLIELGIIPIKAKK